VPWVRLDGYHIVSDLIGLSDLFARIQPVIASMLLGRDPDPRVRELKPWARAAVTTWVLTTLAALVALAVMIVLNAPSYLERGWQSLLLQRDELTRPPIGKGVRDSAPAARARRPSAAPHTPGGIPIGRRHPDLTDKPYATGGSRVSNPP
jgi:putative peptide zinc metalloprotease protein